MEPQSIKEDLETPLIIPIGATIKGEKDKRDVYVHKLNVQCDSGMTNALFVIVMIYGAFYLLCLMNDHEQNELEKKRFVLAYPNSDLDCLLDIRRMLPRLNMEIASVLCLKEENTF
jgi:hypothetical protein